MKRKEQQPIRLPSMALLDEKLELKMRPPPPKWKTKFSWETDVVNDSNAALNHHNKFRPIFFFPQGIVAAESINSPTNRRENCKYCFGNPRSDDNNHDHPSSSRCTGNLISSHYRWVCIDDGIENGSSTTTLSSSNNNSIDHDGRISSIDAKQAAHEDDHQITIDGNKFKSCPAIVVLVSFCIRMMNARGTRLGWRGFPMWLLTVLRLPFVITITSLFVMGGLMRWNVIKLHPSSWILAPIVFFGKHQLPAIADDDDPSLIDPTGANTESSIVAISSTSSFSPPLIVTIGFVVVLVLFSIAALLWVRVMNKNNNHYRDGPRDYYIWNEDYHHTSRDILITHITSSWEKDDDCEWWWPRHSTVVMIIYSSKPSFACSIFKVSMIHSLIVSYNTI